MRQAVHTRPKKWILGAFALALVGLTVTGPVPAVAQEALVTTWRTASAGDSITVPTNGRGVDRYDFEIDWGDGMTETITGNDPDPSHIYAQAGTYTVRITGTFPRLFLNGRQENARKLRSVEQWGTIQWESMDSAFEGAENLVLSAPDEPDLSSVTDIAQMFRGAGSFNQDIGGWDVSNIVNMKRVFEGAASFNQDIGGWDVSNVTNMNRMFEGAASFNQDIGGWDVSGVTDMSEMFMGASSFNQDIGGWDVSSVGNMRSMFKDASSFNQDLGAWDVSGVIGNSGGGTESKTMARIFSGAALSASNYDRTLIGWAGQDLQAGVIFGADGILRCNSGPFRTHLIKAFGWRINDEGLKEGCPDNLTASSSKQVTSEGIADFDEVSAKATFRGVSNQGWVTVSRHSNAPRNSQGIGEANVSQYRLVIAGGGLRFDSAELQFAVSGFGGITQPDDVTVYSRPQSGSGAFESLSTRVDDNRTPRDISDDSLSVTTDTLGEFVLASDSNPLLVMEEPLRLNGPSPNPVSKTATMSLAVKKKSRAVVTLYNMLGQEVGILYEGTLIAGESRRFQLDASGLSSGTYFVQLKANGATQTQRLTVIR